MSIVNALPGEEVPPLPRTDQGVRICQILGVKEDKLEEYKKVSTRRSRKGSIRGWVVSRLSRTHKGELPRPQEPSDDSISGYRPPNLRVTF